MNPELITVSEDLLFNYLITRDLPVMEFEIIKHFIPSGNENYAQHSLFVKHFSIYHALYKLKFSAGLKGCYLHMDCMRIRLIHIPGPGLCRHYYPEQGSFCGASTPGDFCIQHLGEYGDYRYSATLDILQDFYTDPGNIVFGDSMILKKLMSGVLIYSFRKKEIDDALRFLGIHKPGRKKITDRYRELAREYHPDKCGGSEEMMKKLNSAYMILKDIYIL